MRALARGYRFTLTDPESSLQDLVGRFPGLDAARARAALGRLTAAFLGDAGVPGVLDARQLSRWSAWARAHGLPSGVPADPRYALAAARSASG